MSATGVQASSHPAFRRRAGDGAVFTSSKCPPGPGLQYSCELPFGFVWTPLSPSPDCAVVSNVHQSGLPPILCRNCLAYLNLYCDYNVSSGRWTCAVCGETENVAPPDVFASAAGGPSATMACPLVEYHQPVVDTTKPDVLTFVVVMDDNIACKEAHRIGNVLTRLFATHTDQGKHLRLGLVTFGEAVAVHQLGIRGIASSDVFAVADKASMNGSLVGDDRRDDDNDNDGDGFERSPKDIENRNYLAEISKGDNFESFIMSMSAIFGVPVETSRQEPLSRKEMLRRKKEARLRQKRTASSSSSSIGPTKSVATDSPWSKQPKRTSEQQRCTGEAIQHAMNLATFGTHTPSRTTRILLFSNGCPNKGEGNVIRNQTTSPGTADVVDPAALRTTVASFHLIGKTALKGGVGLDVFCTGAGALGMHAYQALVEPSAGYALPHDTFDSDQFDHNLQYVVGQTYMSSLDTKASSGDKAIGRLDECVMDIRLPRYDCKPSGSSPFLFV